MKYGLTKLSIIPVRKEPAEQSEMISQLLFGELFTISYENESWCKIQTKYDEYVGWIDKKMCSFVSEDTFNDIVIADVSYSLSISGTLTEQKNGTITNLVPGSSFPNFNHKQNSFILDDESYVFAGEIFKKSVEIKKSIVETANLFLGSPYLWGGRSPFGIDCSGFTQLVYKINGVFLPRDAGKQIELGHTLNFLNEAHPGDLAFFDNEEGLITHVGILLGTNKIIHASGTVRVDIIDHQGIFNTNLKRYTHKLRVLKSLL